MKTISLCLIALIAISVSATEMEAGMESGMELNEKFPGMFHFREKRSIMNIMTQVEATMKNGGPLDAITRLLDEYDSEIRNEQIAHDALYEKQSKECKEEKEFRDEEIANGKDAGDEARERLAACQGQKARAENTLRVTKKHLREKTSELINIHSTRNREKYDFDTFVGYYNKMIPAIEDALGYIEQIFSGAGNFLQLATHTNKMLVNCVQLGSGHHMAPILGALAQIASAGVEADVELLDKIKSLFLNLKSKIQAEHTAAIAKEEDAIKKYNEEVARVKGCIEKLETQKVELEKEIDACKKCITIQTNRIQQADAKVLRNSQLLDKAKKMCDSMTKQYESASEGRKQELLLLDAIKVKVNEHYAKLSEGVKQRGELDNFKNTYENKSKWNKKEFKA